MNKKNKKNEPNQNNDKLKHTGNDQSYYNNKELTSTEFARDFEDCCNVEFGRENENLDFENKRNLEIGKEFNENNSKRRK